MNTADKLLTVAGNVPKVYEAGKNSEYNEFWTEANKSVTAYWSYAFSGRCWTEETFKPTFDILPKANSGYMFCCTGIKNLKSAIENAGVVFDTSGITYANGLFQGSLITHLPAIDLSNCLQQATVFASCSHLVYIEEVKLSSKTTAAPTNMFQGCTALEEVRFGGEIALNGLNLQSCKQLSRESLLSLTAALADKSEDTSGTEWKVTIGSDNIVKLSEEEINVAADKGWVID